MIMRTREQGFTLTELSIASCMILVVMVGASAFFRDAFRSLSGAAEEARTRNGLAAAIDGLQREVELCSIERALVTSQGNDRLTVQVPVAMTPRGPVYGARTRRLQWSQGQARQEHPGWSIRFGVDQGRLVREVLDEQGVLREGPDVLFTGLREPASPSEPKGFEVTWQDPQNFSGPLRVCLRTNGNERRPGGDEAMATFHLVVTN